MMLRRSMRTREVPISVEEFLVKCPSCEGYAPANVMIMSKYLDFFYIPIFPTDKDANVICKTCGLKRFEMNFDANLLTNYNEVKGRFRHPWFTYLGSVFFGLIVILVIMSAIE